MPTLDFLDLAAGSSQSVFVASAFNRARPLRVQLTPEAMGWFCMGETCLVGSNFVHGRVPCVFPSMRRQRKQLPCKPRWAEISNLRFLNRMEMGVGNRVVALVRVPNPRN
jgi:hypothetical protein